MGKKVTSFLLACILLLGTVNIVFSENINLARAEVEKIIEEVASKRGIPSVIMKSIAKIESGFRQFSNGSPLTSKGGNIGIMQVSGKGTGYNLEKLKYNPRYNIEAGADMLLRKWQTANNKMAQIGNMDPNILEHWYFALWGYNGLLDRNNPNVSSKTYQSKVYEVAFKEYGQKITTVSRGSIPSRGYPKNNVKIETPQEFHEGDIQKYKPNDIVKPDTMERANGKDSLVLYDNPMGNQIGTVTQQQTMTILEEPVLKGGYYFYKVQVNEDSRVGWVYGNWISLVQLTI